jgi:hypothetical protein
MGFLLDILTFLILLAITARQLWRIFTTGKPSSVGLVYISIFIVYGLPLIYKYTLPAFTLGAFPISMEKTSVQLKYDLILLIGITLLWLTSIRGPTSKAKIFAWDLADIEWSWLGFFVWIGWFLLFLPLLVILLFAPNKSAYFIYGEKAVRAMYDYLEIFVYGLVAYAVLASLGGYFVIRSYYYFATGRAWTIPLILATFIMLMNVYLHGKRSALIIFLLTLGFFHLLEKRSKKILFISALVLLTFFFFYLPFGKGYVETYAGFVRGDLSRDYTLSFTIDYNHWSYNEIMPRRGNSLVWLATAYIPRRILPSKGWPTPTYFTCKVFGRSLLDQLPWGFGIGFFEEFMLNFGYLGLLLFIPLGLLLRGLDHLIYRRSSIYCILWVPVLYNVMFATSAALPLYVTLVIPILFIYGVALRKRHYSIDELGEPYYLEYLPDEATYHDDYSSEKSVSRR